MRKCHLFSLLLPTLLFYCCLLFLLLIKLLLFFLFGLISFNFTVYMIYKEIMIDHVYKEPICTSYYSPKENELSCPAYWFTMNLMIVLIVGYLYIKQSTCFHFSVTLCILQSFFQYVVLRFT